MPTETISHKLCLEISMQDKLLLLALPFEALNLNYLLGQSVTLNGEPWVVKGVEMSPNDSSMVVMRCCPSERRKARSTERKEPGA